MSNAMTITPKETSLYGYKFRSRLEARWAVFLTQCHVKWQYEVDRFALPSGSYLPDFWVPKPMPEWPNAGYWLEIKGQEPTTWEQQVALELAQRTMHRTTILVGDPGEFYLFEATHASKSLVKHDADALHLYRSLTHDYGATQKFVDAAITDARSARFEHGALPPHKRPKPGNLTGVVSQYYPTPPIPES